VIASLTERRNLQSRILACAARSDRLPNVQSADRPRRYLRPSLRIAHPLSRIDQALGRKSPALFRMLCHTPASIWQSQTGDFVMLQRR